MIYKKQIIPSKPQINKVIKIAKLVSVTGAAQIIVQAISLISGIIVIRLLPVKEYAFYTIANTLLGTMTLLADGGISTGVLSQGAKVWNDKIKLGVVIATGLKLRKKFAIGSLLIAVPILIYLLQHNGSSWLMCLLIVLSLIPAFFAELSDRLLEIPPKLMQDITKLQKNEVVTNLGRLLALGLFLFIFPWTYIALLASGIPRILGNLRLKKISANYAIITKTSDPIVEKEILSIVKRILPGAVYYCFSGQITIWIVSLVGSTSAIATVGALVRLTMLLSIFSSMFSTLVAPRFAKLPNNRSVLFSKFVQVQFGLFILSGLIILSVWLFSSPLLWVLGKHYQNMHHELLLGMIGSCLALIAGGAFSLYTTRGWVMSPFLSIPLDVLIIVFTLLMTDTSTIAGVFIFNIYVASLQILMNVVFFLFKVKYIKEVT